MFPTESSIEIDFLTLDVDDVVATSSVDFSQEEKNTFPWLNVRNIEECSMAQRQFKQYFNDVILAPYGHIKRDQKFFLFVDFYFGELLYDDEGNLILIIMIDLIIMADLIIMTDLIILT